MENAKTVKQRWKTNSEAEDLKPTADTISVIQWECGWSKLWCGTVGTKNADAGGKLARLCLNADVNRTISHMRLAK